MGRSIPIDCPHGGVLDWGDFGPDSNDGSVGACEICNSAPEPDEGTQRVFLVRPGDTLVFGNVGPVTPDPEALAALKDQLGLAAVYVFAEDIDMAQVTAEGKAE